MIHTGSAAMATPSVTPSASQARLALRKAFTNQVMIGERASAVSGSSEAGPELGVAPFPVAAIGAEADRLGAGPGPEECVTQLQRGAGGEPDGHNEVRLDPEPALRPRGEREAMQLHPRREPARDGVRYLHEQVAQPAFLRRGGRVADHVEES